jgi:uncharacterized protein
MTNHKYKKAALYTVMFGVIIILTGCSTLISSRSQKKAAMKYFSAGDYRKAEKLISEYAEAREGTGDELMWHLEHGTVNFVLEDYSASIKAFEKAENVVKDHENRATFNLRGMGAEVGAAYTNANALPYTGYFFEKILINAYKSMNYLAMNNPDAAAVEMRRARFRQKMARRRFEIDLIEEYLYESPKYSGAAIPGLSPEAILNKEEVKKDRAWLKKQKNFQYGNVVNPTVNFLSAVDFLAQRLPYEALLDFRILHRIDAKNPFFRKCYVTLAKKLNEPLPEFLEKTPVYNFPLDRKVVYLFFEEGLIPARKEKLFEMILPPPVGYVGIAYPILEYFPSDAAYLQIKAENGSKVNTQEIGDFGAISSFALDYQMKEIITRAVIGALVKEATSIALQQTAKIVGNSIQNGAGDVAQIVVFITMQIYKKVFNRADVRCWQTLPMQTQGAVFPKTGNGIFKLSVISKRGKVMNTANINVGTGNSVTIILVKSNGFDTIKLKVMDY